MDEIFQSNEDLDFPKSDDALFRSDQSDWQNNAWLAYQFDKFGTYADGYRQSADKIVQLCIDQQGTLDILIYPTVFLYRQYLELRLKELILGLNYCMDEGRDFPKHHQIDSLWLGFLSLYSKFEGTDGNDQSFKNAERVIKEFASIDPKSMAFRYPVDKEGKDSLSNLGKEMINIRNLGEVMSRLANLLDAVSWQIAAYKDIKNEMYSELYSYYS